MDIFKIRFHFILLQSYTSYQHFSKIFTEFTNFRYKCILQYSPSMQQGLTTSDRHKICTLHFYIKKKKSNVKFWFILVCLDGPLKIPNRSRYVSVEQFYINSFINSDGQHQSYQLGYFLLMMLGAVPSRLYDDRLNLENFSQSKQYDILGNELFDRLCQ